VSERTHAVRYGEDSSFHLAHFVYGSGVKCITAGRGALWEIGSECWHLVFR